MKTLYLSSAGVYTTASLMSLISSTPLLDAASISTMSVAVPSRIALQALHLPHGLPLTGFSQLTALAIIFAQVVFPVPLGPQKR